jgi:hypothetical protein
MAVDRSAKLLVSLLSLSPSTFGQPLEQEEAIWSASARRRAVERRRKCTESEGESGTDLVRSVVSLGHLETHCRRLIPRLIDDILVPAHSVKGEVVKDGTGLD